MIAPPTSARESALDAWGALGAGSPPRRVEVLQGKGRSIVLRLVKAGPGGEDVVAQWFAADRSKVERAIRARRLPPEVATPHCWGFIADGNGCAWGFFEHVEGRRYRPEDPLDRKRAARWLAALHEVNGATEPPLSILGLDHWRAQGREAREAAMTLDATGLRALVHALDRLDTEWNRLEEAASLLPRGIMHGDFSVKNLIVQAGAPVLIAFDWGEAAHGSPAIDLAHGLPGTADPDLDLYVALRRERDASLTPKRIEEAARAGTVLRAVSGAVWATERDPETLDEHVREELDEYTAAIETWLAAR